MPNTRDDKRLPTPSQLLIDVLTHIEDLRRVLTDTEAMAYGAEDTLSRLPYLPFPGRLPSSPGVIDDAVTGPATVEPERRDRSAVQRAHRLDAGRMHTYVTATAASLRQLMSACDDLIVHTERRIEQVRGMRMVPPDGGPGGDPGDRPGPTGGAAAATTPPSVHAPRPDDAPARDDHGDARRIRARREAACDERADRPARDLALRARAIRRIQKIDVPFDAPHFLIHEQEDDDIDINPEPTAFTRRGHHRPRAPKPDVRAVIEARYRAAQSAGSCS
ncbi:hypothetical protein [Haliangium sp.]|uniref:hypothetical protein n=1 Tax=Haliangium sp. TaxID=2663208 RepID=UPI003D133875